ncbi:MAG: Hpt domain-containing protein [Alcaligenaceae bacterium]|nr:Hpt domain-containing protein [Alcaligenaceae bacterium]
MDTTTALTRLEHDKGFYIRLLKDFSSAARRLTSQITLAARQDDAMQIQAAAHQLKSTAATVGAQELSALCALLEKDARQQPQTLRTRAQLLQPTLERALSAQEEWLRLQPEAGPVSPPQNPRDPSKVLAALKAALLDHDMQSLELCDELMAMCNIEATPELQRLQSAMDAFETEEALRIVDSLLTTHIFKHNKM